jgi:hypothetical protein
VKSLQDGKDRKLAVESEDIHDDYKRLQYRDRDKQDVNSMNTNVCRTFNKRDKMYII